MSGRRPVLLGCGILRREVRCVCERRGWALETHWLDAGLHGRTSQLGRALSLALAAQAGREVVVLYGCCHPRMDDIVARPGVRRVIEQNCLALLLGAEEFARHAEAGAYFLLEEWTDDWAGRLARSFGTSDLALVREIFRADRSHLVALRTPCSNDYEDRARAAARTVGLPLHWRDCGLGHLERALEATLSECSHGSEVAA